MKYHVCKTAPALVYEAMECLGGNGYVEEAPLARLYREAPLNGIWEGSGNVICLDALRSLQREPEGLEALRQEIDAGGERVRRGAHPISKSLGEAGGAEPQARRVVEFIALALQASLMARHASAEAADAFLASRLEGGGGRAFGTLSQATPHAAIIKRQQLAP